MHGVVEMGGQGECLGLQSAIRLDVVHKSYSALKSQLQTRLVKLTGTLQTPKSVGHLGEHQLRRQH